MRRVIERIPAKIERRQIRQHGSLEAEVARSDRTGHPFALLLIDLDHFKLINDRYGHQSGDEVLKRCAAALRRSVRTIDFVARYGGEEFCLLLPETSAQGARRLAERLRETFNALPRPAPTISVGISVHKPRGTVQEILEQADEALYRAKKAGRDCVVVHGDEQGRAVGTVPRGSWRKNR